MGLMKVKDRCQGHISQTGPILYTLPHKGPIWVNCERSCAPFAVSI